jgi:hypothetical protein
MDLRRNPNDPRVASADRFMRQPQCRKLIILFPLIVRFPLKEILRLLLIVNVKNKKHTDPFSFLFFLFFF